MACDEGDPGTETSEHKTDVQISRAPNVHTQKFWGLPSERIQAKVGDRGCRTTSICLQVSKICLSLSRSSQHVHQSGTEGVVWRDQEEGDGLKEGPGVCWLFFWVFFKVLFHRC